MPQPHLVISILLDKHEEVARAETGNPMPTPEQVREAAEQLMGAQPVPVLHQALKKHVR